MRDLAGRTVALVGNGPSATDQGQFIDACDFVVRQARWLTQGSKNTGAKVSAICGYNNNTEIPAYVQRLRDWELWCNVPAESFLSEPTLSAPFDWNWLLRSADGRIIRLAREELVHTLTAHLRNISLYQKNQPYIDLGLACIMMALDRGADRIHLWGYDRTGYGKKNDDWGQEKFNLINDQLHHDYRARAVILADLVDKHLWVGEELDLKEVVWHGRPQMPELAPDPEVIL